MLNKKLEEAVLDAIIHISIAAYMHHEAGQELDIANDKLKSFYLKIIEVKNGSKKEGETDS